MYREPPSIEPRSLFAVCLHLRGGKVAPIDRYIMVICRFVAFQIPTIGNRTMNAIIIETAVIKRIPRKHCKHLAIAKLWMYVRRRVKFERY